MGRGLAAVSRTRRPGTCVAPPDADRVERNGKHPLENAHCRPGLVVAGRVRRPDLAHHGHRRRTVAAGRLPGSRNGRDAARRRSVSQRRPGSHRRQEQPCVAHAGRRRPARVRSFRRAWHGLPDDRRPDRVDARAGVRSSSRTGRLAGHLEGPVDRHLRRPRRAVHDRAGQADRPGPLEGRSSGTASLFDADS